jgi:hypothetical protein
MGEFPSRDHQFGPGNQAAKGHGRPPGRSIDVVLKRLLHSDLADEQGRPIPFDELVAAQLARLILGPDESLALRAIKFLAERTCGRPAQSKDVGDGRRTLAEIADEMDAVAESYTPDRPPGEPS